MSTTQIAVLAAVFLAFSLASYVILRIFALRGESRRIALVSERRTAPQPAADTVGPRDLLWRLLVKGGAWLKPEDGREDSPLRIQFLRAGLHDLNLPAFYSGIRMLLALGLPASFGLGYALTDWRLGSGLLVSVLILLATAGYYLPKVWLDRRIRRRQLELSEHFPDALDLIRLCVEAGLGLNAAIARVEKEIRISCEPLHDELHLVSLELRAGASRERSLKNLALRMGLEEVDALVAMLIQVERFGTSVADSLRIHSETFRTKRRQRAEEQAAKVPVKLLFPMIFCIFPGLMVVLLAPAVITLFRTLKLVGAGG